MAKGCSRLEIRPRLTGGRPRAALAAAAPGYLSQPQAVRAEPTATGVTGSAEDLYMESAVPEASPFDRFSARISSRPLPHKPEALTSTHRPCVAESCFLAK